MTDLYCDSDACVLKSGKRTHMARRVLKMTVPEREFKPGMQCPDCSHVLFPKQLRTLEGVKRSKKRAQEPT